jgi:ectoine hydroxylase-related dioxygenase (phytanoyl-CoA dioxygenase family)
MQFVPGSHATDVRPHRRLQGWPPLITVDDGADLSTSVACPLAPGGATFHHCRTLHYTAPNSTDTPRRAWSLAFHAKAAPREAVFEKPWLAFGAGAAKA